MGKKWTPSSALPLIQDTHKHAAQYVKKKKQTNAIRKYAQQQQTTAEKNENRIEAKYIPFVKMQPDM